jgi:hypothetical protein
MSQKNLAKNTMLPSAGMKEQMGLDIKTKKKICREIYCRYQKARKKTTQRFLMSVPKRLDTAMII